MIHLPTTIYNDAIQSKTEENLKNPNKICFSSDWQSLKHRNNFEALQHISLLKELDTEREKNKTYARSEIRKCETIDENVEC